LTCPIPHDEAQRLAVLHELRWLDSGPEPVFDALTRLASTLLDVPIAVVSLVDTSRQWFKSRVGLDAAETTREAAFCAHAIMGTDTFVVGDARDDQRFADNPLVTGDPHIRAYAGVPLTSIDGHALGTLCAIDREPRQFSDRELDILRDLASIARHQIVSLEQQRRAETLASRTVVAADDGARLMHAMVEHAGIGIAMVGLDGAWLRVNPKMAEILGRTREDLMSRTFQEITHPDDLDEDMDLVQQLLAGTFTSYALEKRYLKPDGSIVWGNLTVSLVRDAQGSPAYFVSLIEDISQRQAAEEALRQLRRQLEERVAERTADLQAVLAQIGRAHV
jgi:PAS domain S-box-containing protein